MKNAQNYGRVHVITFLGNDLPFFQYVTGQCMCQKKPLTRIHGSVIWKLFCHDVLLNAIVQNVSKRELKQIEIKKQ